jgi:AcrR family transcriptional regulator
MTNSRTRIPTPRGDDTRERLLEAAMDRFAERGFAGTTTRAICDSADVHLALLGYHFGSKLGLWAAVVRVLNDRLAAIAREAVEPGADLKHGVATFLRKVVRALLADPRPLRIMVWASLDPKGFDRTVVEDAYGPAVRAAIGFLEAEQAAGRLPPDIDPGLTLVTFYGLVAEPLVEPLVHQHLFGGVDAARIERHLVASGLRLLGLPPEDP